jgi:hypothetical protein
MTISTDTTTPTEMLELPLGQALFGRRARRFGLGMEIPSGPLAFTSRSAPLPLSPTEQAVLVAAATGVTGWNDGVPFGPARPGEHARVTQRFTGRTAPTAGGFGTPVLFYTDDDGVYLTNTRDTRPEPSGGSADRLGDIVAVCRRHTRQLSGERLDLPRAGPHMLEPNAWMANAPGSTLFMPVGDVSEQILNLIALFTDNGYLIMDDRQRRPAGNLAPFIRSGLLDEAKVFPLSMLELSGYEANTSELAFMGHNIVLALQSVGLGGLYFNGVNRFSVLGAFADQGVKGLGFRFVHDDRWTVPTPVGLDGHYETLCPPYHDDMRAAVRTWAGRKFGPGGAYDPAVPGAWRRSREVKESVSPYSDEFLACVGEVAQYVHDTYGKFPGTVPTIALTGYVQAHHLDTEFYDTHHGPGAYLETHATHLERWHHQS